MGIMACDMVFSIHSSGGSIQVWQGAQRWRGRGLAGQLFMGLGRQGKELCRQRHITGRGPGKCQNKMCWLRLEMKIHSWLPQADLFTSQRPAQAEGLVTECSSAPRTAPSSLPSAHSSTSRDQHLSKHKAWPCSAPPTQPLVQPEKLSGQALSLGWKGCFSQR